MTPEQIKATIEKCSTVQNEKYEWRKDVVNAPYGQEVLVRNKIMDEPVLAFHGWVDPETGYVSGDRSLFTRSGSRQVIAADEWAYNCAHEYEEQFIDLPCIGSPSDGFKCNKCGKWKP